MPDFDHFLLTRFSAVMSPGAEPASKEWLYYRLGFFYDVTYRSVQAQQVTRATCWSSLTDRLQALLLRLHLPAHRAR